MQHILSRLARLSRTRQVILAGALLAFLAVFMPWHMIGTAELASERLFSGLNDQNFILGALTAICAFCVLLLLGLPILGLRAIRLPWRDSAVVTFLGFEASLLTFVALIQHTTSDSRYANDVIQMGLYFAFIGSLLMLFGGHFLTKENTSITPAHTAPLTHAPRHTLEADPSRAIAASNQSAQPSAGISAEDRRMKLDL